jgi:predicted alpha/beta-hydrolase family hydrolase
MFDLASGSHGRARLMATVGFALLIATSCDGTPTRREPPPTRSTASAVTPTSEPSPQADAGSPLGPTLEEVLAVSQEIAFRANDGEELEGRLFGEGDIGVVLAHGADVVGQATWFPFAPVLARRGYGVLTFNFRGFCGGGAAGCSGFDLSIANNWRDVAAAVDFLRAEGSETVFVIGASMGGIASLTATSMPEVDVAGVVSMASPQWPSRYYGTPPEADITAAVLRRIEEPKLFVAGEDDVMGGVAFAREAESMYGSAKEPKQLALLPSHLHSSALITGEVAFPGDRLVYLEESSVADRTIQLILDFIAANR